LLGRGGLREGAFDVAKGCLFLIEDKRKNDTVLASYVPEAVSQAIVLHKSTNIVFLVLKENDGKYEYYESSPLQLSPEDLKHSDTPLREIVQLLFEWVYFCPVPPFFCLFLSSYILNLLTNCISSLVTSLTA
jgi:hypothetical protein